MMGYRSDVVFAFYPSAKGDGRTVSSWVAERWPQAWCDVEAGEELVIVRYTDVKWYDDYEFVKAAWVAAHEFEEAFATDDYDAGRAHWEMVRLGEDDADIECGGSAYRDYRLRVRRDVEVF